MTDPHELISRIKKIKSEYEAGDQAQLDAWITQVGEIEALRALADNFIIKDLIKKYTEEIASIDLTLCTKRKMAELERENLLDKKSLYQEFIKTFDANNKIEEIVKMLDLE